MALADDGTTRKRSHRRGPMKNTVRMNIRTTTTVLISAAILLSAAIGCGTEQTTGNRGQPGTDLPPQRELATLIPLAATTSMLTPYGTGAGRVGESMTTVTERAPATTAEQPRRADQTTELTVTRPEPTPTATPQQEQAPEWPVTPSTTTTSDEPDKLSHKDQACLNKQPHNAQSVVRWAEQADRNAVREATKCLSDKGKFEIYLLREANSGLTGRQMDCIWRGLKPIWEAPAQQQPDTVDDAAAIAESIIRGYCIQNASSTVDVPIQIDDALIQGELDALYCMVEQAGGPYKFAIWMIEDPLAIADLDALVDGEDECELYNS